MDAEKLRKYLHDKKGIKLNESDLENNWYQAYLKADNRKRLELLQDGISSEYDDYASLIVSSDESGLLEDENNGNGKHFILYPPIYPWNRAEDECTTEDAAKQHVCNVLLQFLADGTDPSQILKKINYIYQVNVLVDYKIERSAY